MAASGGGSLAIALAGRGGVPVMELVVDALGRFSRGGGSILPHLSLTPAAIPCHGTPTSEIDLIPSGFRSSTDFSGWLGLSPSLPSPSAKTGPLSRFFPHHDSSGSVGVSAFDFIGGSRGCCLTHGGFLYPSMIVQACNAAAPDVPSTSSVLRSTTLSSWSKFGDLPLEGLASIARTASSGSDALFSKVNLICYGSCAAILFFNSTSTKDSSVSSTDHGFGTSDNNHPEDNKLPEGPVKDIFRLLRKLLEYSKRILLNTTTVVPKKPWLIQLLHDCFGPAVTGRLFYCVKLLKYQWDRFYFFICYGLACFSLNVGPIECCMIIRHYLLERQEDAQKVLSALSRDARKVKDDVDSVDAIVVSAVDMETHAMRQVIFFLRGQESAAVFSLLDGFAMCRPLVPESRELNNLILQLKGKDTEVMLTILKKLSESQPPVPKRPFTKPSLPRCEGQSRICK